jgi:hypothetical protein
MRSSMINRILYTRKSHCAEATIERHLICRLRINTFQVKALCDLRKI